MSTLELRHMLPACTQADENFTKLGYSKSLYDLQSENGVTRILAADPHYTFHVFPGPQVKKNTTMEVYGRPTIPWKLECEESKFTKQQMIDLMRRGLRATPPAPRKMMFAIIIIFFSLAWTNPAPDVVTIVYGLTIIIVAVCGIFPWIGYLRYFN